MGCCGWWVGRDRDCQAESEIEGDEVEHIIYESRDVERQKDTAIARQSAKPNMFDEARHSTSHRKYPILSMTATIYETS